MSTATTGVGDIGSRYGARVRRRTLIRTEVLVLVLVTLWLVIPVLRLAVDEGSVPSNRAARAVPAGIEIVTAEVQCGSGGCWRDLTLQWPDHSAAELRAKLGLPPGSTGQRCGPASLLDRRYACVGVDESLTPQPGGSDLVRVEVWWMRPGWR